LGGEAAAPLPSATAPTTLPGPKSAPVFVPTPSDAPQESDKSSASTFDKRTNINTGQINLPAAEPKVKAPTATVWQSQPSTAILPGSKSATPVISVPFGSSQQEVNQVQVAPGSVKLSPLSSPSNQQSGQTSSAILQGSKSFTPIISLDGGTLRLSPQTSAPPSATPVPAPVQTGAQSKTVVAPQSKVAVPQKSKTPVAVTSQPPAKP
jgi:hypothetical protein